VTGETQPITKHTRRFQGQNQQNQWR